MAGTDAAPVNHIPGVQVLLCGCGPMGLRGGELNLPGDDQGGSLEEVVSEPGLEQ